MLSEKKYFAWHPKDFLPYKLQLTHSLSLKTHFKAAWAVWVVGTGSWGIESSPVYTTSKNKRSDLLVKD